MGNSVYGSGPVVGVAMVANQNKKTKGAVHPVGDVSSFLYVKLIFLLTKYRIKGIIKKKAKERGGK